MRGLAVAAILLLVAGAGWSEGIATSGWEPPRRAAASGFVPYFEQTFDTDELGPVTNPGGWAPFGFDAPGFAESGYDPGPGAYYGRVAKDPYRFRISGVGANFNEWVPYAAVGPGGIVRAKYYIYSTGQENAADGNEVPNLRLRLSCRFALSSMLEVFHHLAADPSNAALAAELRPSDDASSPSVYRVDLDPVDVPFLVNSGVEGVMRAMEAYALEPQENGDIAMTECVVGIYPATLVPAGVTTDVLLKVYEPGLHDAGNLAVVTTATDLWLDNKVLGTFSGDYAAEDWSAQPRPVYTEAGLLTEGGMAPGVTLDTGPTPATRVGIIAREFHPGSDRTDASYVRVEPGRQYQVRWHLTAARASNLNSQIRLRARSVKFAWSHKLEMGGAWAAGSANNTMAQQILPGVGCQNPDRIAAENGGWYTHIVHTPLEAAIRPGGLPVEESMPLISGEPGPGVDLPSQRDLRLGIDIIDTISPGANAHLEQGQVTVDRIEVRVHDLVPD